MTIAGQRRRIFVALPPEPAPQQGYPVLYALDGNALFPLIAQLARNRAARPDGARVSTPVVVGLGYATDAPYDMQGRTDDYTLAEIPGSTPGASRNGADRFLAFLEHDVQPWLARQLPIDPQRQILFGHSYGGLLTLYALFTRSRMFQNYVAASPSIWWGDRAILPFRDHFVRQASSLQPPVGLLITAGSLEKGRAERGSGTRAPPAGAQAGRLCSRPHGEPAGIAGRVPSAGGRGPRQPGSPQRYLGRQHSLRPAVNRSSGMSTSNCSKAFTLCSATVSRLFERQPFQRRLSQGVRRTSQRIPTTCQQARCHSFSA